MTGIQSKATNGWTKCRATATVYLSEYINNEKIATVDDEVSNMHHISTSLVIEPCMKEHALNMFSEEEMPEQ